MSYPPQDPYGSQSGPYGSQPGPPGSYPSGSYPSGQYPPPNASDDFWRHVAGSQPPSMPPKKNRTGLIIGLVSVGAVVVIGIVVTIILLAVNSGGGRSEAGPTTAPTTERSTTRTTERTTESTTESSGSTFAAGSCVSLVSEKGGEMNAADCGSTDSDYKITDVVSGNNRSLCLDDYTNVVGGKTYCIELDVKQGDCLTNFSEAEDSVPLKIECSKAEDQVTKVADSTDPKTACAEGEGYYVFEKRTVCFGNVQ
ncbi:hypothetical protein AB0L88_40235 [Saccharopolyspora shandongensis]|uniref:hypothetical protein n=1 Tax=Saccharopolyspora shandongensis TaxID=418495 RepID=UPI003428E71F